MVSSLSSYYPDVDDDQNMIRLLAKVKTIAAYAYKKSIGQPFMYPKNELSYCANFLHMMFAVPAEDYEVSAADGGSLECPVDSARRPRAKLQHLDGPRRGQQPGGFVRFDLGGDLRLSGPLHGGANQAVLEMLEMIRQDGGDYKKYVNLAKDKNSDFRLMGFGHRVYKNFDPRATILRKQAGVLLKEMGVDDPLLEIARHLEEVALER